MSFICFFFVFPFAQVWKRHDIHDIDITTIYFALFLQHASTSMIDIERQGEYQHFTSFAIQIVNNFTFLKYIIF